LLFYLDSTLKYDDMKVH